MQKMSTICFKPKETSYEMLHYCSDVLLEMINYMYLGEKQLQYPVQVLVLWGRLRLSVHLFEVVIQKCNNAH